MSGHRINSLRFFVIFLSSVSQVFGLYLEWAKSGSFRILFNSSFINRPIIRPYILWHADPLLGKDREISSHTTPIARQQICNTKQCRNWEALFSTRYVRQLHDATSEELLGEVFSMRSVPRIHDEEQLWLRESLELAVRRIGVCCETDAGQ
jgi:hypothetical protein